MQTKFEAKFHELRHLKAATGAMYDALSTMFTLMHSPAIGKSAANGLAV
jgi:hypothetical protein